MYKETVTWVHHWTDKTFSFKITRNRSFRFINGEFAMIGLPAEEEGGRPLLRAYSIASANYEDELEFLSIKVPDGPLTSRLQHLKVGDEVLGDLVATMHPYQSFYPKEEQPHSRQRFQEGLSLSSQWCY